jgi:mRNA-degrading endonuclease toxin of MazEF toxin-antitoxin module
MTLKRGEIWLATLDPTKGSEQTGTRPIIIFYINEENSINFTNDLPHKKVKY